MKSSQKIQTRAQAIGVKPKMLVGKALRTLGSVRKRLEPLAEPFDGVDGSVDSELEKLLNAVDEFAKHINATEEWLNEPIEE